MDHYSLETLAKLHQRELIQEGLRGQANRRQNPGSRVSNWFRQILFLILSLTGFLYWLFV